MHPYYYFALKLFLSASFAQVSDSVLHYATTPNGFTTPPRGWNSFGLQSLQDGKKLVLNQESVIAQCDNLETISHLGYTYCSLDSGWSVGCNGDENGRTIYDSSIFNIPALATILHDKGLKLGIYINPGFFSGDKDKVIEGTNVKFSSIAATGDGNPEFNCRLNANWDVPGAQEYCDSNVKLWASWGVDYIKLDYVNPGSPEGGTLPSNSSGAVACYHRAIEKIDREIFLEISWKLDWRLDWANDIYKSSADAMRMDQDINNSGEGTLVSWSTVQRTIEMYRQYILAQQERGANFALTIYPDLDNLYVGNAQSLTGITDEQRKSVMAHWIGAGSSLLLGSDLTQLDDFGLFLLSDGLANEIAGFTAKYPMRPLRGKAGETAGYQHQVWIAGPDPATGVAVILASNYGTQGDSRWFIEEPSDDPYTEKIILDSNYGLNGELDYLVEPAWNSTQKFTLAASEPWRVTLGDSATRMFRVTPLRAPSSLPSRSATRTVFSDTKPSITDPSTVILTRRDQQPSLIMQSTYPIESPDCGDYPELGTLPKAFNTQDGRVDQKGLLFRLRNMICNGTCSAPEGIPHFNVAVVEHSGGCEISVAISDKSEAYGYRSSPNWGVEQQQCWDSTAYIIERCMRVPNRHCWWNGNHVFQFYEIGFRPLNTNTSYHGQFDVFLNSSLTPANGSVSVRNVSSTSVAVSKSLPAVVTLPTVGPPLTAAQSQITTSPTISASVPAKTGGTAATSAHEVYQLVFGSLLWLAWLG
ncbi:glycoside hydrolase superfamily [Clohesyomyces aquaticus]|uniref:Alpha-galactosidase n=1 Tax=Clohesyomyces aquaticus TaxID=1231657 RepID=A0A1Y1ZZ19_9PLEO|nr:glycoside hydrolase superfamily [Clohesyomyces aquaticus]